MQQNLQHILDVANFAGGNSSQEIFFIDADELIPIPLSCKNVFLEEIPKQAKWSTLLGFFSWKWVQILRKFTIDTMDKNHFQLLWQMPTASTKPNEIPRPFQPRVRTVSKKYFSLMLIIPVRQLNEKWFTTWNIRTENWDNQVHVKSSPGEGEWFWYIGLLVPLFFFFIPLTV